MSRLSVGSTALAAAGMMVLSGAAGAQETTRIEASDLESVGCFGQASCGVEGVELSVSSGTIAKKSLNGATGFGVSAPRGALDGRVLPGSVRHIRARG